MYIKKIELENFRNYQHLAIDFSRNVNLLLGSNAQGKTNLLEGIYITSMGRSFRTNKDSDLVNFKGHCAKVKAEAVREDFDISIEIIIKKDSKKSIRKDGRNLRKTSELLKNILIVIFSPEDLKIVKDEPEKRRKFIDRELCQIRPSYYENLSNYKKTLLQRNIYLKEDQIDYSMLDLWDIQLAHYGARIMKSRESFIEKIRGFSAAIHSSITNGKELLSLEYEPNIPCLENLDELEGFFYDEIKKAFKNDHKKRTTTKGPHKDDLSFYVNGVNMRNFGSQGQQRTCALSLKLAELNLIKEETDEDAILLLDDVMSELDLERQEYLIKTLKDNQLFITTTEIDQKILNVFPQTKTIYIENGHIRDQQ